MSKKRKKFKLEAWKIIVLIFISYLVITFVKQEKQLQELSKKKIEVEKEVLSLEAEVESMKAEIENSDSLVFVEKIARDELGMVKPREILVIDNNKKKNPFVKGSKKW